MAIGAMLRSSSACGSAQAVVPCSVRGSWFTAATLTTAQSATNQLKHVSIDDATFAWCEVPPGVNTRVIVRARYLVGATVTTSPVGYPVGAWGADLSGAGAPATDGTVQTVRLDSTDSNGTGITLTLVTSGTGLTVDGTYAYSDLPTLTGYDLLGARYFGWVTSTAASTGGAVTLEAMFLN